MRGPLLREERLCSAPRAHAGYCTAVYASESRCWGADPMGYRAQAAELKWNLRLI